MSPSYLRPTTLPFVRLLTSPLPHLSLLHRYHLIPRLLPHLIRIVTHLFTIVVVPDHRSTLPKLLFVNARKHQDAWHALVSLGLTPMLVLNVFVVSRRHMGKQGGHLTLSRLVVQPSPRPRGVFPARVNHAFR